jgi:uncharacterized protein YbjT (DUF2867 family)
MTVLVVGATGSIGRLVVESAVRRGHAVRALARDPRIARKLLPDAEVVVGDLTRLPNMPLQEEPQGVRQDLEMVSRQN